MPAFSKLCNWYPLILWTKLWGGQKILWEGSFTWQILVRKLTPLWILGSHYFCQGKGCKYSGKSKSHLKLWASWHSLRARWSIIWSFCGHECHHIPFMTFAKYSCSSCELCTLSYFARSHKCSVSPVIPSRGAALLNLIQIASFFTFHSNFQSYCHQGIFKVGLEIDEDKIHKTFSNSDKNKWIPAGQCRCLRLFQALKNRRQTSWLLFQWSSGLPTGPPGRERYF